MCFFIMAFSRAFLASPILRELSSVRQENRLIKVRFRSKESHVNHCFLLGGSDH